MGLTSQLNAEASFGASFESACGDVVESLDQLDVAVKVVESLQLDAVLALPGRGGCDGRGVCFELAVEIGELGVVSDDLGIAAGDAVLDLAPFGGVGASADGAESVEVLPSIVSTPAGAVSVELFVLAFLCECPDVP
jgi:hypothetical protein